MSTKSEKLLNALRTPPAPPMKRPKVTAAPAIAAALPNSDAGVERMGISLHGTDLERLNAIEDYMRTLGHRESNRSLLIKVALRGVELTPALVDHLKAAQAEDGRRKKGTAVAA